MIPGVGKKTAARIVLELKEKLVHLSSSATNEKAGFDPRIEVDALSALVNLGYTRVQSLDAINLAGKSSKSMSLEDVIREALKNLVKNGR